MCCAVPTRDLPIARPVVGRTPDWSWTVAAGMLWGLDGSRAIKRELVGPQDALVGEAIRRGHYSRRREEAYAHWIKRFIYFGSGRRA
jgi:hypothetical protein